jgi:hypothetical protein
MFYGKSWRSWPLGDLGENIVCACLNKAIFLYEKLSGFSLFMPEQQAHPRFMKIDR